jgi:spore germination protein GerM
VTGGGDQLRPFHGSIPFETAPAAAGAVVFFTESAENGEVWQAAVVRVRLTSTDTDAARCGGVDPARPDLQADEMEVKAYFSCADDRSPNAEPGLVPVYRAVPKATAVLRSSLEALTAGPTAAERRRGISSFFSPATDDALRSVVLRDGHAVVDFDDLRTVIPNASSSAGSAMFLAELDATVFQFRSVQSVEYRLEGDCEAFNEWLQLGGCAPRTRPASQD